MTRITKEHFVMLTTPRVPKQMINWLDTIYTYCLLSKTPMLTEEHSIELVSKFEQGFDYINNKVDQNNPKVVASIVDPICGMVWYLMLKDEKVKLDFSSALPELKSGRKLAREGWNGKGMFIYLVPENKYPADLNNFNTLVGIYPNDLVPYQAYIAMKTATSNVVPWVASQTDLLAEDWSVVE